MDNTYDVIIVGGGLAGLSAACLFGQYGFKTLCLDAQPRDAALNPSQDLRTTAISYGSHLLLKAAKIWPMIEDVCCPIERIDIKDGQTPTLLPFLSEDVDGKAFGWIIDNLALRQALHDRAAQIAKQTEGLTHICGATMTGMTFDSTSKTPVTVSAETEIYTAQLLIGADGRHSKVRESLGIKTKAWQYNQSASVFIAYHENPHHNLAVEHFRNEGPFAILPMLDDQNGAHRSCVVWSDHSGERIDNEAIFLRAVQERFPDTYGYVQRIGAISNWPLSFQHAHSYVATHTALIAEAAHVMHPIAGQGLNMSLRDVAAIIELCVEAREAGQDIAGQSLLERYEGWRKKDNRNMGMATDGLNTLFSNRIPAARIARNMGLEVIRRTPIFKRFFMTQAMGQVGDLPKLIKGEDLAA